MKQWLSKLKSILMKPFEPLVGLIAYAKLLCLWVDGFTIYEKPRVHFK